MHASTYEYLKPTDDQIARMARVRAAAKAYGDVLETELPKRVATSYATYLCWSVPGTAEKAA